jgi:hypothetical protein
MTLKRGLAAALLLSAGVVVSACASGSAYAYNGYFAYPYDCTYALEYDCAPFAYGYGGLHRFDHFHAHPMHAGHGFGGFGGHGFAGRGGGGHR